MPAQRYDFDVEQGACWVRELIWNDAAGDPVDLSDYKAEMQVRTHHTAATATLDLSSEGTDPEIALGGAAGTITITLGASATVVDAREYLYDLLMTPNSEPENAVRLLQGKFIVSPAVTRAEAA